MSDSPNGTSFFLPASAAQGLANYPHARSIPVNAKVLYVSGTSSRRGDGTYAGCTESPDGTLNLSITEQTAAVLKNIGGIIDGASGGKNGLETVVDATVFLTDMKDYAGMNSEWNKVWPERKLAPSRTCIQVAALPNKRLNVEIKVTAIIRE